MDKVFIERVWRSLKSEDIYLKGYADGCEDKDGIAAGLPSTTSIAFDRRSAIAGRSRMARGKWDAPCGDDGQGRRVAHMPIAATDDNLYGL
ncbi:hypothetical protein I6F31_06060 [Bradyrhizobium sp. NBAIM01]|nr:hypothetical protein [Bradyrhizobium sp. NBAIM01]